MHKKVWLLSISIIMMFVLSGCMHPAMMRRAHHMMERHMTKHMDHGMHHGDCDDEHGPGMHERGDGEGRHGPDRDGTIWKVANVVSAVNVVSEKVIVEAI